MALEKREKKYFGTNGVRGVTGVDMTPVFALSVAEAFGTMLGEGKKVGIGRDTRTSGPSLGAAVRAGLMACGCDVIDFDIIPTPGLQYLVLDHKLDGGVMITASHNPPEYNGIKIIEADGTEMGDDRTIELEEIMIQNKSVVSAWDKVGDCTEEPQARKLYIDSIVAQFPKDCGKGITVVVDPGNGPAAATTPDILRRLGCNVHTINAEFNGLFPGRLPEPSPEGLANLSAMVQATGAAFGVAHDGDADRAIFVDENGTFMDGNITFALLASYFCEKNTGGIIVTPVSTSGIVEEVGKKYNCTTTYTVVGSIYVARTMRELIANGENIIIGGEGNGGIIYPNHQFCRDGGMSAATMLGFVAGKTEPLSKLIAGLPAFTMYQEKRKTAQAKEIVIHMKTYFADCPIDDRDGMRITRGGAWALIRPSGTEPLVRVFAESQDPAEAKTLLDEIFAEIKPYLE
ncbi:MAG: phosphoglucosamine mutase [Methanocorpusculum sp.]|uniref:phosphoglucosamine mutase n=1 Tax=Methanocorpusculum sp. TaxID=2058474 RepID=UPI00271723F7|nr:phosphoglucosamine mutase [Methanocorpusculum sp.]MDO9522530.1 phosphoglucosamine mutase [Methanocorpusculum sp.]